MIKVYIIDNNSIHTLAKYYWNIIEGIRERIEDLIKNQRLISSIKVFEELKLENKEGFSWAKEHKNIFIPISSSQFKIIQNLIKNHPKFYSFIYPPSKSDRYADPFLIALAIEEKQKERLTKIKIFVITEETAGEERLKIPQVCGELGLNSTNLQGLFKEEGWKLVIANDLSSNP